MTRHDKRNPRAAWLLDVQCGEIDDDAVEPGRPDGLGRLSPTLESFVDIMGVDRDPIATAAEGAFEVAAARSGRQVETRDMSGRTGRGGAFGQRIAVLREAHARKPSLLARLRRVGL